HWLCALHWPSGRLAHPGKRSVESGRRIRAQVQGCGTGEGAAATRPLSSSTAGDFHFCRAIALSHSVGGRVAQGCFPT
ncbi:MAG: hypothetical protein ABSC94_27900, partial [Polyangiaceae bacterium]